MTLTDKQIRHIIRGRILEMAYPVTFDFNVFKSIGSFAGKIQYCEQRLQRIASGSSRIAYRVDNEKVLKLAKNRKGLAQNKEEAESYATEVGIGAQIFDYDRQDYFWIEMQSAQKAKPTDFKRILGIDFRTVCRFIDWTHDAYARQRFLTFSQQEDEAFGELLDNNEWFSMLYYYMADTVLEAVGDLKRISSWGIVKNNGSEELVLIDFGISDDVAKNFYH